MSDPTTIVEKTAPAYASMMGEEWDEIDEQRREWWRALAFKVYELHVANKLDGLKMAIDAVEAVQVAESTPKSWLRGAQETKNALVWLMQGVQADMYTAVEVPDSLPADFDEEDPYKDLRAGDLAPEIVPERERCNALHADNWSCTRRKHPDHWSHWDSEPGDFYDDDQELIEYIHGCILATWHNDYSLETLHPAFGDLE